MALSHKKIHLFGGFQCLAVGVGMPEVANHFLRIFESESVGLTTPQRRGPPMVCSPVMASKIPISSPRLLKTGEPLIPNTGCAVMRTEFLG